MESAILASQELQQAQLAMRKLRILQGLDDCFSFQRGTNQLLLRWLCIHGRDNGMTKEKIIENVNIRKSFAKHNSSGICKKGFFFSTDAFFAATLLVIAMVLM